MTWYQKALLFLKVWLTTCFNMIWPLFLMLLALCAMSAFVLAGLWLLGPLGGILACVIMLFVAITVDQSMSKFRNELEKYRK